MKVLIITSEWPGSVFDISGIHVVNQVKKLRELKVDVSVFNFYGRKNPLCYLKAILDFKRLPLCQYDVIHAHHGQSGLVALSQNFLPVIVTFHGSDLQGIRDLDGHVTLSGYMLRFLSRWVASHANRIILVAPHLVRYLPATSSYQIVPVGIDLHLFRPLPMMDARVALELPLDSRLVLFVGNPARTEKRFWLAQKVMESLSGSLHARLVVANNVPSEQMPLYMNACNVLLLTSSSEGSPSVVKEALACNIPIVSTDVGDVRQRVEAINGCIVCADDQPESLAKALSEVLQNDARIQGREMVLDMDEDLVSKKIIDIYERVIEMWV
jgi:glycosyltransferase involved in cell wall biosynthesis